MRSTLLFSMLTSCLVATLLTAAGAAHAADADLQISSYTWTPDPVVHNGTATFTLTVQNNGPASSTGSTLTINLPANVSYLGNASGCAPSGGNTILTCPIGNLNITNTSTIVYTTSGGLPDVQSTWAFIVDDTAGNTDPNPSNDTLNKIVTSINGADLSIVTSGPASATAGSTINFTLQVSNSGPDEASSFRVTDSLPAGVDFQYLSATGSDWSCSQVTTTVTCDYSGPAIASGNNAPAINLSGKVITSAGSIINGASVASTDGQTGDPLATNNGPSQVTVTVTAGTDLRANKSMVSVTTGLTTYAVGEAVALTLSATNTGTQNATGVVVADTVPANFTIGALPGSCSRVGQAVTCSIGALNAGVTSGSYVIPLTAPALPESGSNTATISRTTPVGGNNQSATVNYTVALPFTELAITKSKVSAIPGAGSAVQQGENIINTITVRNTTSSTSPVSGVVRVMEALSSYPNETYLSAAGAGWLCVNAPANTVTCDYDLGAGTLARGALLPSLILTTQVAAGYTGSLSNTVCTGSTAGSPHTPADVTPGNDCTTATVYATAANADLGVTKTVSDTLVTVAENALTYTITVSNHGAVLAPTVNLTDTLPMFYNDSDATPGDTPVTVSGIVGPDSCSVSGTGVLTCTLRNLAGGESRAFDVTLARPFRDGAFTNTVTISSPDLVQNPNTQPDSASAPSVTIDPIADVAVTSIAVAPDPVKVGVQLTFTTSIKNFGPSTAQGVVLRHVIDPNKVSYVSGSASLTLGGSCAYVSSFSGAPYVGEAGIECTGFTMANDQSRQLVFKVVPVHPYPGGVPASYTSSAEITTTTTESSPANNSAISSVAIIIPQLDLTVTKQEKSGYDPVAFGDDIVYWVKVQNNGPSLATQVELLDTPTPPVGGYTAVFVSATACSGGAPCTYTPASPSCSWDGIKATCWLAAAKGNSTLPANSYTTFVLTFTTGPLSATPSSTLTYSNSASVSSLESSGGFDTQPANNTAVENTTALPKTDLTIISKTVSSPAVSINEPFTYSITLENIGPSPASGVRVTDTLPAGFVMNGAVTVTSGSNVSLASSSCSTTGTPVTITCDLANIPADPTGTDPTRQVVLTVPVKAAYPYTGPINTDITNTASIAVLPNTSVDLVAGNNSASAVVQVRKSTIGGTIYADNNRNDSIDGGEPIVFATASVTFTLSGPDLYGNTLTGITVNNDSSGNFLFDRLPPGTYQIIASQPAGYYDRFETAGTAGGTTPPNICDGTANCGPAAGLNTISAITLPLNTSATGYIFQEYQRASLTGYVYHDANNDGDRGAGESTGISGQNIVLSGVAYNGVDVCSLVTCTVSTNASGVYTYGTLPPSDASGYTINQTSALPAPYLDGLDQKGDTTAMVVPGSAGRTVPESMTGIVLLPNQGGTEHNFGELRGASLAGYVYVDADIDAVKDAGETSGLTSVIVTLTGTDDLGNSINRTTTTAANGAYSFTALRPGSYTVTETVAAGVTHTGAQAGSKGGTINGAVRAANVAVPGAYYAISTIAIVSNDAASGYNFGESGQGLSGLVYLDRNNNGVVDGGEPGIAGVSITLSGTTSSGSSVCAAISPYPCTVISNASGLFSFSGLPASNGSGYTLTEQSQATTPLTNYADGAEILGSVAGSPRGTANNDNFTGIVLVVGEVGSGYTFGERGGSISGSVYHDADNDGVKDAGEAGINGISLTLSGTTASGVNVCTLVTCALTTDSAGDYSLAGLPASNGSGYTLTEAQQVNYGDGRETAGSAGGTVDNATFTTAAAQNRVSAIVLSTGANASGYLFGEQLGSMAGFVYYDANNNGVKDGGEVGISGVVVTLAGTTAASGDVCAWIASCTTTTDATGAYRFADLPASNGTGYTVTETQPISYGDGLESVGSAGGTAGSSIFTGIMLAGGTNVTGYLFGERLGSISGTVFYDTNGNGVMDGGEVGISGVSLTLAGTDINGVAVSRSVTSNASGIFTINDLPASNGSGYSLSEVQPVTYADGIDTAGTAGGFVGGLGTDVIAPIVLNAGINATGYLFSEGLGGLSGMVFHDRNGNGSLDAGENGISGVTLTLSGIDAAANAVNFTTTTAASGAFTFADIPASNGTGYTLTETQPVDYAEGVLTVGSAGGSDSGNGRVISGIHYPAGTSAGGYRFAELLGSLSGTVFTDTNGNGTRDPGEAGISGVSLTLAGTAASTTALNRTVSSDGNGDFLFPNLPTSNGSGYTLTESQPVNYADGPETAGTAGGTPGAVGTSIISAIVITPGSTAASYLFAEKLASFSGYVYSDANDNGSKDGGETGIAGVTIDLTGTDVDGSAVNRTTSTAADGSYSFLDVLAGSYTLTETHLVIYNDGRETAGSAGGSVDNSSFTSSAPQNRISAINLPTGAVASGYLFAERPLLPAQVAGTIWHNTVSIDKTQQAGEPGLAGWRIEAVQGAILRGSAVSASDGSYQIANLPAGIGYELRFRHPTNLAIYGDPLSQDPGYTDSVPDYSGHTIANLTLRSGANLVNQNLPVDPSGIVYDAFSRTPIAGATVSLAGPPGFTPALHLAGGAGNQAQLTDSSGFYQFLLLAAAPAGNYTLSVTPPPGYVPAVSALIPVTAGPFDPGPGPGSVSIQAQFSPPTGVEPTTYYLSFTLSGATAGVVNNHLPVDPVLGGAMTVRKSSPLVNVSKGDLVPYTIEVSNNLAALLPNIDLFDQMPPGFKYRSGTATINGSHMEPVLNGRTLRWPNLSFTANETKTLKLLLVVGAGVSEGKYTNQAWAVNNLVNKPVSNIGTATVRIIPDPTFDCTDVIGKVFDDKNANGYQDEGEPGIAAVRMATARGWLVTTDAYGRFHVACAAIPQADRGSNFVMKLDERTLPSGFRMTTENPQVVRATRGKIVKLNFGATIHRVVRLEVSNAAFIGESSGLRPEWQQQFDALLDEHRDKPSLIRLAYRLEGGSRSLAEERLNRLSDALRNRWQKISCCYPLAIEQEIVEVSR